MLHKSESGRKVGRRMFRWPARSTSGVPSTMPKPTRESEAAVPAPVPVTFCLGLWRLARRSPVRWWLRLWAYQPNALRSPWRETWIFEAPLAYQKTCPSALRYAKGASKIQVSLHRDLNAFGWYAHSRSHHLTGDLRTSRQSPKQKVTGTGTGTAASDSLVGFGMVDGTPDVDRACHRNIRLSTLRPDCDLRGIWVTAVLLFQRLLKRSKIHGNLGVLFLAIFR